MRSQSNEGSPTVSRRLALAVALVAAAMLLLEIVVTRLFSVLFYYHFSFFAISLVMSGLVVGGLIAARWNARLLTQSAFESRLAVLALLFGAGVSVSFVVMSGARVDYSMAPPSVLAVILDALVFLPGLVAAGAFLALAFARDSTWIGPLYAADLAGAALASVGSILALRVIPGPVVLVLPVLLTAGATCLLARGRLLRGAALVAILCGAGVILTNRVVGSWMPRHRTTVEAGADPVPMLERWNEHSRVVAFDLANAARYLVIDRSAGTLMRRLPRDPGGGPPTIPPEVAKGDQYLVYALERQLQRVAIIGVGGGSDLLPPLYYGAKQVDGYELNQILIDLLERDFSDFNSLASRPEVHLRHTEARVGITHSGERYDVIQASLIDTWAATASGGFVLSENGLYTVQGWRTFLDHLTDTGVLTMTRWYVRSAPAETHRLVSLAAAALLAAGWNDVQGHVILLLSEGRDGQAKEGEGISTILVSKKAFTDEEVAKVEAAASASGARVEAAPGRVAQDPTIRSLLSASTRERAIRKSPYDITPPTDARPYFFLQIRPSDLVHLARQQRGVVTEITFNGVRVMMILAACSLALVLAIAAFIVFGLPSVSVSPAQRRAYRFMTLYFLAIGLGYILVQLGLHQSLIVVLGHPTLALSVVLFGMLLGTSAGAAVSARLFPSNGLASAGLVILGTVGAVIAAQPLVPHLEAIDSQALRIAAVGTVVAAVGFVLGFAFPLGIRRIGSIGDQTTQKMWAINGAASITGSALASLVGLSFGSTIVLCAGLLAYVAATASGALAERTSG